MEAAAEHVQAQINLRAGHFLSILRKFWVEIFTADFLFVKNYNSKCLSLCTVIVGSSVSTLSVH